MQASIPSGGLHALPPVMELMREIIKKLQSEFS
jgi:hypothetical protein